MIDDPGPSIPSVDKKERTPPIEEVISRAVASWIRGQKRLKPLKETALKEAGKQLAIQVQESLGEETPENLSIAIVLELKHQVREATESKELRTRRIRTLGDFLDEDLRSALRAGVEKAAIAGIRELHRLSAIAEETNLEIHQVLIHAKKEFSDTTSTIHNPIVREAVLCKVQALEEETTIETVTSDLAKGLGIPFMSRLRRHLQQTGEAQAIAALLDAAGHQAAQQFHHPLVRTQVLDEIRDLRLALLD